MSKTILGEHTGDLLVPSYITISFVDTIDFHIISALIKISSINIDNSALKTILFQKCFIDAQMFQMNTKQ